MHKKRIAIIFPTFNWGGAGLVCSWILVALKDKYDVTIVTYSNINAAAFKKFYDAPLDDEDFKILKIPYFKFLAKLPMLSIFKQHLAMRFAKKINKNFDLLFSAFCEMDMGVAGLQYIHYPILKDMLTRQMASDRMHYSVPVLKYLYKNICESFSSFQKPSMEKNFTITNSDWTASVIKEAYNIDSRVIHPPVCGDFREVPWEKRKNSFICIGRLVPEKEFDSIIEVLGGVRKEFPDVCLHIVGVAANARYGREIKRLVAENSHWVTLDFGLPRSELIDLIAHHKYGMHAMVNEHFGLTVAEMVAAGCLVFVPDSGGQADIIKRPELLYKDPADAASKISRMLKDEALQERTKEALNENQDRYLANRFVSEIQQAVNDFLGQ